MYTLNGNQLTDVGKQQLYGWTIEQKPSITFFFHLVPAKDRGYDFLEGPPAKTLVWG